MYLDVVLYKPLKSYQISDHFFQNQTKSLK